MVFTKEELKNIEKHICRCKDSSILIAAHDNMYTIPKVKWHCKKCKIPLEANIRRELYIDNSIVNCPICNDEQMITILNIRD
jgi:hypothetical protein